MKVNTKSSITLPADELALVEDLRVKLNAKSKVDVIRQGLRLLKETSDRKALRLAFQKASEKTRAVSAKDIAELDHLANEGLKAEGEDEW